MLDSIERMPIYESAWKSLCDFYDNERKIVNDIVLSFIDMEPVKMPSRAAFIALVNNTNRLLQSLPFVAIESVFNIGVRF